MSYLIIIGDLAAFIRGSHDTLKSIINKPNNSQHHENKKYTTETDSKEILQSGNLPSCDKSKHNNHENRTTKSHNSHQHDLSRIFLLKFLKIIKHKGKFKLYIDSVKQCLTDPFYIQINNNWCTGVYINT